MASWMIRQTIDLDTGVVEGVKSSQALMVEGDTLAHTWQVTVKRGGEDFDISDGIVTGDFYLNDERMVTVLGTVAGNIATVVLAQECYAAKGALKGIMRLSRGNGLLSLSELHFVVQGGSTVVVIDPGKVVPNIDQVIAEYQNMQTAEAAAIAAASAGNGALRALGPYNAFDVLAALPKTSATTTDITWTWDAEGRCHVSGTAESTRVNNIFRDQSAFPLGIEPGGTYKATFDVTQITPSNIVWFDIRFYINGGFDDQRYCPANGSVIFTVPADATGALLRLGVSQTGVAVDTVVTPKVISGKTLAELESDVTMPLTAAKVSALTSLYDVPAGKYFTASGAQLKTLIDNLPGELIDNVSYLVRSWSYGSGHVICEILSTTGKLYWIGRTSSVHEGFLWVDTQAETTRQIHNYNAYDLITKATRESGTSNGITYDWDGYSCTVRAGTVQGEYSANVLYLKQALPETIVPGGKYYVQYVTSSAKVRLRIIFYDRNGANLNKTMYFTEGREITIPEGAAQWLVVLLIGADVVLDSDVIISDVAILDSSEKPWINGGGVGDVYNNEFNMSYFQNTYNIDCQPTITTDTNNYLASTNDYTDRTAEIQSMLNTTGVCHLGPGRFVVTGIEVPDYGALIGSGNRTVILLQAPAGDEEYAYAVKLRSYGSVENMRINGQSGAIALADLYKTVDATTKQPIGKRHGIVFEGTTTYPPSTETPETFYRSRVHGCVVIGFTGGGITCNATGLAPASHLLISDCEVFGCGVGLNIPHYSEFHRISNCAFENNYYGCINNGGNVSISCCDFSANICNLLMDDSAGQSRNNSHGTFTACQFAHPYSEAVVLNEGTMMRLLGLDFSELFIGCRFGNGTTEIRDCVGIRFSTCRFAEATTTIANNRCVTFDNCMFRHGYLTNPTLLTLTNNQALHFNDCYCFPASASADALPFNPAPYKAGDAPVPPVAAGTYVLRCTVSNGVATYSWEAV